MYELSASTKVGQGRRKGVTGEARVGAVALADKSKCADIYQEAKVDGLNMYEARSNRVMLKYKYDRAVIERKLARIKVMLALAGLVDVFFIKCVLKRIHLTK